MTQNLLTTTETYDMLMKQNLVMQAWALDVKEKLKTSASQFTKGKSGSRMNPTIGGPLLRKYPNITRWTEHKLKIRLDHRMYAQFGIYEGIGFGIQRHGVFVHRGVGRGYQVRGGMVVRVDGKGVGRKKLDRQPINAPIKRFPVDWFNKVVDANTNQLADDVARINENAIVNSLRMRIN
jgi:hypothetical protein